jgi:hypothetical protein
MIKHGTEERSTLGAWIARLGLLCSFVTPLYAPEVFAQDDEESEDESSFTVNAMMKLQGGLFVPLASDKFSPHKNTAYDSSNVSFENKPPCDPVLTPAKPCYPTDHGQRPGTPSITRATLQMEAHWDLSSRIALHAIVRGTRGMQLEADERALVPTLLDAQKLPNGMLEPKEDTAARRRAYAKKWVQENQYNTFELREFYADILATDWLNFRIGRQQVAWGETGSFRLLDVVNPINSTWHFGPLESFEDQRIPLWMALTNVEIPKLLGALELLYIPGIDRARDTVTTPLSNAGAWGIPYSNQPGTYQVRFKDFQYPGGELSPKNMRYGLRWKGDIDANSSYSFVYMYTHMQTPVLQRAELHPRTNPDGSPLIINGAQVYDDNVADRAVLNFPRQHIAGASFEYAFPSPAAVTVRFEGAFEPNRTYSQRTDTAGDSNSVLGQITYAPRTKKVLNYAVVFQRPTMIRWLNPVQNFLLVAQFQHTVVFDVDKVKDNDLVQVIGYNNWQIQPHSFTAVFYATTQYLHGLITPRLTGVYIPNLYYKDSGFISFDVGFRIGPHYRVNVTVTDFLGNNPYRDLGLFRDRDEVHASATVLF